jgi:hypothetical protein
MSIEANKVLKQYAYYLPTNASTLKTFSCSEAIMSAPQSIEYMDSTMNVKSLKGLNILLNVQL